MVNVFFNPDTVDPMIHQWTAGYQIHFDDLREAAKKLFF